MPHVLVLDDDEITRRIFREVLESDGYEVSDAPDGSAGMALYRQKKADLIIADILMPGQDGLETIRGLLRESPEVRVIAISSGGKRESFDYLEAAKMFGARRALAKPIDPRVLLRKVREVLSEDD